LLFRTLTYGPLVFDQTIASLDAARAWVTTCIHWYHHDHVHSGIRLTTPASRHTGTNTAI
jgi:hypothetical protein